MFLRRSFILIDRSINGDPDSDSICYEYPGTRRPKEERKAEK
jgi:hypothetical protein